eukprot:TRINITY_DN13751_c0_g1_i1.p1 TRINITY_DN13751_c0_g1~~TRINITY_DN13751_c0_g1_i1.p1  ORF type:complete len:386 (+),score=55.81 TRINITY_DN13751_c0_g1_i1:73-1230(+)
MTSSCPLDHFVVAVPNLQDTIDYWTRHFGITPVIGGRHTATGTWNALLALEDGAYLEFLAIDDSNTEFASSGKPYSFGVTREKCLVPQIITWAARSTNIEEDVRYESNASGLEPLPIRNGSRTRPDGSRLEWKITLPRGSKEQGDGYGVVPFLIDWLETKPEIHPAQTTPKGCRVKSMKILTPNVDRVAKELGDRKISYLRVEKGDVEEMVVEIETPSGKTATLGHWNRSINLRNASIDEGEKVNAIYNRLKFFPAKMDTDETVVVEVWGRWIGLGRIAGTSELSSREMAGIWVDEEYRNRGIARMIVSRLSASIQKLAPTHSIFCVPFSKLDGFYKQFGFYPHDVNASDVPESIRSKFNICATRFAETPCSLLKYQPLHMTPPT